MKKNQKFKIVNLLLNKYSILISIFLLSLFWIFSSILFNNQVSFTMLRQGYDINFNNESALLKGKKVVGEFKPNYNNLGIVYVRFEDFAKINYEGEDILQFKIKNKDEKNWFYVNNYRTGMLKDYLLFPFGFPIIKDSANKTYQFEIISLNGNQTNAITISNNKPVVLSGHKFETSEILASKKISVMFLYTKILNSFSSLDFLLSSTFFALPLILYLLLIRYLKSNYSINNLIVFLTIFLFGYDLLILKTTYLGVVLLLILLWIYTIIKFNFKSNLNFILAFFLVILWVIDTYLSFIDYGNKINVWVYILIFIGVSQSIIELYKPNKIKKLVNILINKTKF